MTFTRNDFSVMSDEAAISAASGYADGKILRVVTGAQYQDYEVSSVDSGDSVVMGDGKFANRVSGGSSGGAASWGSITGTLSNQTDLQQALDNKADATSLESLKTKTTKTTDASGVLPNWAAWIADSSSAALTRQAPATPEDGEEVTVFDSSGNAETNNIEFAANTGQTVVSGVLDKNGQSKKFRYDAGSSTWDLVFSDAPASGGGSYQVQEKVLYISDGLVSETDTGATLSGNQRKVIDIATDIDPDWVGEELWVSVELYNPSGGAGAGWADPNWYSYDLTVNDGRGVVSGDYSTDSIVVQSGNILLRQASNQQCDPFGFTSVGDPLSSAKVRVIITRLTYNNTVGLNNLVDVGEIDAGTVSNNTRTVFDISTSLGSDWVGKDVFTKTQIQNGGVWATMPNFSYQDSGGCGAKASVYGSSSIVLQTGRGSLLFPSNQQGNLFGINTTVTSNLPCRIKCYKFTQEAIDDGIVGSTTHSEGVLSTNSRVVSSIGAIDPLFSSKNLIAIGQIEVSGAYGDANSVFDGLQGLGCKSAKFGSNLVTQSGNGNVLIRDSDLGTPFGQTGTLSSAPLRLKIWRLGDE